MERHFFYELVDKYLDGTATGEERRMVEAYYGLLSEEEGPLLTAALRKTIKEKAYKEIQRQIRSGGRTIPLWRKYAVAASIILLLGVSGYLLLFDHHQPQALVAPIIALKNDVAPGTNRAILTLAGGRQIILDSAGKGTIASQGNTQVIKTDSGKLTYQSPAGAQPSVAIAYNQLSTPRGGQYQLTLPDGSRVWLNAASSIRYPTAFTGRERLVEITGEAYFEVAHNQNMPFRVKAGDQLIEDIGTAFNVNAYTDEPLHRTTLVEGSVKLGNIILRPGQQASEDRSGKVSLSREVDVDEVLAWKNGRFRFDALDVQSILRQAARWYDVDIEYQGNINETFTGGIPRNVPISELFNILEYSRKMSFEIQGRKIIVRAVKS